MKKIYLIFIVGITFLFSGSAAYAKYYQRIFVVQNTQKEDIETKAVKYLSNMNLNDFKYTSSYDTVYFTNFVDGLQNINYIRFYQSFNNTNIFVLSSYYDENLAISLNQKIAHSNYRVSKLQDKDLLNEYFLDFSDYIKTNYPESSNVILKKFQKVGETVDKVSDKVVKFVPVKLPYVVDKKPVKLKLLSTKAQVLDDIIIVRNEYMLKTKANQFAHAYEYNIINKSYSSILLQEVNAKNILVWQEVTKDVAMGFDKFDAMNYAGKLLAPATAGVSMVACVPSWARNAKTTKETQRFVRDLPKNLSISAQESARVMILAKRSEEPQLEFIFNISGAKKSFLFE